MKKSFQLKSLLVSMAVASSALLSVAPATTQAGISANAGMVSDYIWRGASQGTTKGAAAAQAGIDYESDSGFYLGTWGSTMSGTNGIEYDIYGGYGATFGEVSLGLGATYYSYSNSDFAEDPEINIGLGYGPVSATYDFMSNDADTYHYSISADVMGIGLTYGNTNADDTSYMSASYGFELGKGVDGNIDLISGVKGQGTSMVFGISKSFDL